MGLIGLYLRLSLNETPSFKAIAEGHARAHSPLHETVLKQWRPMLRLGAFIALTAFSFYTFTTYLATYMQVNGHLGRPAALLGTMIALVFAAAICPLAGLYADAIERRKTMITSGVILIVLIYPSLMFARAGSLGLAIVGALLMALGAAIANVVTAPLLSEVFPTRTRYTASAIAYNFAYTIFGGTAPLVATFLIAETGSSASPAIYIVIVSILGLIGGLMLPETSEVVLEDIEHVGRPKPIALERLELSNP